MPTPVVQGLTKMTDLNEIMKKMTPSAYLELRQKQQTMIDRYGEQDYSTIRDHMEVAKKQIIDFEKLPAEVRAYYKNNRFDFFDDLQFQAKKGNEYYLEELTAKVLNDENYKQRLDLRKKLDAQRAQAEETKTTNLATKIADAIKGTIQK